MHDRDQNIKQDIERFMNVEKIISDFEFIDDWEDRYRYVIDLGDQLEPYPSENKTPETKVQGCVSQVWLTSELRVNPEGGDKVLHFTGDSDAHIVRGLIAIVFGIYSDKTPKDILSINHQEIFQTLDLKDHISPQRSNGLSAMVKRIQADAANAL